MRLTKIKLSGFKSFVDPVSIPVNSNLVGIVGPNGCGKSNIIDAVRWVMGESSAKHLRGAIMADVIFNGSSTRKPVGMASVELVFDNSAKRIGGAFATYSTIAVKRQVSRDGQSQYLLNGSKCRRKDITDIFLGTGLGSRSYAIIEQGMISRLIEAKPDDLRSLLEEAAGISKYKERRHDTEIRIRHTRENLERLNDLRSEVETQINHLKRQAKKAERFKTLKIQEREYQQQLLAIRWHSYQQQAADFQDRAAAAREDLDFALTQHSALEGQIDRSREQQKQLQESLNTAQGELYAKGAEIGGVEQQIQLTQQSQADMQNELRRLESGQNRMQQELGVDTEQLQRLQQKRSETDTLLENANQLEQITDRLLKRAKQVNTEQQDKVNSVRDELALANQRVEVAAAKIDQLGVQNRQYEDRLDRLNTEKRDLSANQLGQEIAHLAEEIADREAEAQSFSQQLAQDNMTLEQTRQEFRSLDQALNEARSQRQNYEGKIASLERLQEHAIGKDRTGLNRWLQQQNLAGSSRLAQEIKVDQGWESAVEMVLGAHLEAICVDRTEGLMDPIGDLRNEAIALIESGESVAMNPGGDRIPLADKVESRYQVKSLLQKVYCASSLEQARLLSAQLSAGESAITADGIWLGRGWLYLNRAEDQKSGVLAREKELRSCHDRLTELNARIQAAEQDREKVESEQAAIESRIADTQSQSQQLSDELSNAKAAHGAKSARNEQICERIAQIDREISDLGEAIKQNQIQRIDCGNQQEADQRAIETLAEENKRIFDLHRGLQDFMGELNEIASQAHGEVRRLEACLENLRSSERMVGNHLDRLKQQRRDEGDRVQQLQQKLAAADSPIEQHRLDRERLGREKSELEKQLKSIRTELERCESSVAELAERQATGNLEIETKRDLLEQVKLEGQESHVRTQAVAEQLEELNVGHETIADLLPEDGDEALWKSKVEAVEEKIARLGPINLAAIDEFEAQSQRSEYLEQQNADLMESLQTLEQAMRKIDLESKSRFKTTFDQINSGLQKNFPKLFGGGQARLELTDTDLLAAGVNVIAQPPGKRNTSIHLLSGGEKALTAVALVFSIFELNPAPFCMLDEVDAPLDEANIGRFCRLVEEMAETVQFVFITHNKATMESAQHLAGVTMNEPGVSRMVAVDIDQALDLAVG